MTLIQICLCSKYNCSAVAQAARMKSILARERQAMQHIQPQGSLHLGKNPEQVGFD